MRAYLAAMTAMVAVPAAAQTVTPARFDHVAILVADQPKSVDFYRTVFALAEIPTPLRDGGPRWLDLGGGVALHIQPGRPSEAPPPRKVHFALAVADLDATMAALRRRGATWYDFAGNPGKVKDDRKDGVRQIFTQDPDGYWIEVNDALKRR